jgi:hypothetical protein
LKLKYGELLSSFAFKFNVRHYIKEEVLRLGMRAEGWGGVKRHPYFADINWNALVAGHVAAPLQFGDRPARSDRGDQAGDSTGSYPPGAGLELDPATGRSNFARQTGTLSPADQAHFADF